MEERPGKEAGGGEGNHAGLPEMQRWSPPNPEQPGLGKGCGVPWDPYTTREENTTPWGRRVGIHPKSARSQQ